jgi:hypothetical protein
MCGNTPKPLDRIQALYWVMLWTVVFFLSITAAQAGQATLAWNASDGAGNQSGFSNEVSATVGAMSSPSGGPPPSPWLGMDIGNIGVAGSASYADGTFTLHGSGADIWGSADAFHFAFQPLEGDGSIVARVASLTHTHAWAKAGVMVRENLDADARHAMVVVTPGNGVSFQHRASTGGSSASTTVADILAPHWVKLTRAGNTFTAHQSPDGVTWTPVGSGKCQGSCRINHVICASVFSCSRGDFPGLSKTEAGGVQLRVGPDQRVGLWSLAAW